MIFIHRLVKIELEKLLQDDEDLNDTRFRLLAWQITGDLNGIPEVSTLSTGYMASCLCLYYVVKVSRYKFMLNALESEKILLFRQRYSRLLKRTKSWQQYLQQMRAKYRIKLIIRKI